MCPQPLHATTAQPVTHTTQRLLDIGSFMSCRHLHDYIKHMQQCPWRPCPSCLRQLIVHAQKHKKETNQVTHYRHSESIIEHHGSHLDACWNEVPFLCSAQAGSVDTTWDVNAVHHFTDILQQLPVTLSPPGKANTMDLPSVDVGCHQRCYPEYLDADTHQTETLTMSY